MCMSHNFLDANFLVPKSGHQLEKEPVLGPTHGFSTSFLGALVIWFNRSM